MSTDVLLNVASAARLFHTSDGTPFADLMIDGHRETWPLRSKRFRAWLRQQYYERTWDAPTPSAMSAALNVLEAQAQFDGPERQVSVRVAEHDGLIYLDLADEFWRCVEIGPGGWRIADDLPVRFRRPAGMLPLPLPARGGSIEELAPFLNLPDHDDFVLVVAWLLGSAARRRSLSAPGHIGRTGLGEDRALENVAGVGRSQRRAGAGAATRRPRTVHRRQQRPRPGLRQSHQLVTLAVGHPLPARERRRLRGPSALHRPGRGAVYRRPAGHSQRHRGRHHPARSRRPCHHV